MRSSCSIFKTYSIVDDSPVPSAEPIEQELISETRKEIDDSPNLLSELRKDRGAFFDLSDYSNRSAQRVKRT